MKFFFMLYLLLFNCLSYATSHPFTDILNQLSEKTDSTQNWYTIVYNDKQRNIDIKIPNKYIKDPDLYKSAKEYQLAKAISDHRNQVKPQRLDHFTEIVCATLIKGEILKILFNQVVMKVQDKKNN